MAKTQEEFESSPESRALKILEKYRRVKLNEEKEREVWTRCYQYVNNWVDNDLGQWKQTTRKKMGNNPMLSIPLVKKFINRIAGAQVSAKIDEKCYPRDDKGDTIIAEILTDLKSYVYYLNQAEYQKARSFRDSLITGRGFLRTCWSDELDPLGEVTIKRINPFRVYLIGDKEEYDVSKMDEVIDESLVSWDKLISLYPEKKEELGAMKSELDDKGSLGSQEGGYDYSPEGGGYDSEVKESESGKYKILRSQKYQYVPVTLIDIPDKGMTEIDEKEVQKIESEFGIKLPTLKKKQKRVIETTICGNVVLEEKIGAYKHNKFDIVGWFAYNDNGRVTGIAQDLLDVQDEKNKRRSQIIKMLGTAAKNSFWGQKGVVDDVESVVTKLGDIGQYIETNGDPSKIKPIESNMNALPAIAGMEEKAEADFNSVSGLTDASLGQVPDGVKSGRGINQLQQGVEVIISELFEHHLMSCKLLAELVIANIQQYYTEPRRVRILGDYSSKFISPELQQMMQMGIVEAVQEGAKIVAINTQKLNDVTSGRYDVVVDATSASPTTREKQFYDVMNLKTMGAPIAWSDIIKYASFRGAQEMAQKAAQAEQMLAMQTMLPPQATSAPPSASAPKNAMPADTLQNVAGAQTPM